MKYVVSLDEVELYEEPAPWTRFARILVDRATFPDTPVNFCVFTHPAGGQWPAHSHVDAVELYFILEGELTATIDGRECTVAKNDLIYVPAGVRHWTENRSEASCTFITVHCPAVANISNMRKTWIRHTESQD